MVWNKGTKGVMKVNSGSFKVGRIPWNKGTRNRYHIWPDGRVMTQRHIENIRKSKSGEKNPNWKGGRMRGAYEVLHARLNREYGKPSKCENLDCDGMGRRFEYALIHGKNYELKRDNFIELCSKCHRRYDRSKRFRLILIPCAV